MTDTEHRNAWFENRIDTVTPAGWATTMSGYVRMFKDVRSGAAVMNDDYYSKVFAKSSAAPERSGSPGKLEKYVCYSAFLFVNNTEMDRFEFAVPFDPASDTKDVDLFDSEAADMNAEQLEWVYEKMGRDLKTFTQRRYTSENLSRSDTHKRLQSEVEQCFHTLANMQKEGGFKQSADVDHSVHSWIMLQPKVGTVSNTRIIESKLIPDFGARLEYEDETVMHTCNSLRAMPMYYMNFFKEGGLSGTSNVEMRCFMQTGVLQHATAACIHVLTENSVDTSNRAISNQVAGGGAYLLNVGKWYSRGHLNRIPHLSICAHIAELQKAKLEDASDPKVLDFSVSHKKRGTTYVHANVRWKVNGTPKTLETYLAIHMSKIETMMPDFSRTDNEDEKSAWLEHSRPKSLTRVMDSSYAVQENLRKDLWEKLFKYTKGVHDLAMQISSAPSDVDEILDTLKDRSVQLFDMAHAGKIFATFPWDMYSFLRYAKRYATMDYEDGWETQSRTRGSGVPPIDQFYNEFRQRVLRYANQNQDALRVPGTVEEELVLRKAAEDMAKAGKGTGAALRRARLAVQQSGVNETMALRQKAHVADMALQLAVAAEGLVDMGLATPISSTPSYEGLSSKGKKKGKR